MPFFIRKKDRKKKIYYDPKLGLGYNLGKNLSKE